MTPREVCARLRAAAMRDLRDLDWLRAFIAEAGLRRGSKSTGIGSTQEPEQFARYLASLARGMAGPIQTYVEIGAKFGGSILLASEYLARFWAGLQAFAIDLAATHQLVECAIESGRITIVRGDSRSLGVGRIVRALRPDVVFIDGDHAFAGVVADFHLARGHAHALAFHDIACPAQPGVVKAWAEEIRPWAAAERRVVAEFSTPGGGMGIGLVCQREPLAGESEK